MYYVTFGYMIPHDAYDIRRPSWTISGLPYLRKYLGCSRLVDFTPRRSTNTGFCYTLHSLLLYASHRFHRPRSCLQAQRYHMINHSFRSGALCGHKDERYHYYVVLTIFLSCSYEHLASFFLYISFSN